MFTFMAAAAAALPAPAVWQGAADTVTWLISYFSTLDALQTLPLCSASFDLMLLA